LLDGNDGRSRCLLQRPGKLTHQICFPERLSELSEELKFAAVFGALSALRFRTRLLLPQPLQSTFVFFMIKFDCRRYVEGWSPT